jgi:hypothetical protein
MSARITEAMVEAGAGPILDILNTAALAFPTDPAAKHLAKRLARAALAAALSTEPGEAEDRALLDELSRLRGALEPFARADRAFGDEPGPFRFETGRGHRLVEREHFRAAARVLSEREGQE